MNLIDTELGQFFFKCIVLLVFIALMKGVWQSAVDSLKRSGGKWTSIIDEVIEGVIGVAIFFIVISGEPSTILGYVGNIVMFLWGIIATVLREYLGMPV